eukprot:scaffold4465_cov47-Phaeocystis_antarctica.AAC.2
MPQLRIPPATMVHRATLTLTLNPDPDPNPNPSPNPNPDPDPSPNPNPNPDQVNRATVAAAPRRAAQLACAALDEIRTPHRPRTPD